MTFRTKLYYETPRGRPLAEVLSFACDVGMFLAATFLATALLHRSSERLEEVIYFVLWAAIPRLLTRGMSKIERPRESFRLQVLSGLFVLCVTFLLVVGWDLVYTENRQQVPMGTGTAIVILLTWCSMLLLFQASAYRLFDFLCGSTLLLGLLEAKPLAWIWVPAFLFFWLLGASTRHWLHDVAAREKPGLPFHVQNARILAVLGSLGAVALFFLGHLALTGSLDFPRVEDLQARDYRPGEFIARSSGAPASGEGGPRSRSGSRPGRTAASRRRTSGEHDYGLPIASLGSGVGSQKVAWKVTPAREPPAGTWPPPGDSLWRGVTCSTFVPRSASWVDSLQAGEIELVEGESLPLRSTGDAVAPAARLELDYEALLPIFQSYLALETPLVLEPPESGIALSSPASDILPLEGIRPGTRYRVSSTPRRANRFPSEPVRHDQEPPHLDPRYLEVPPTSSLGVDLESLARKIFRRRLGGTTIQEKLSQLRAYFVSRGFLYNRLRPWRPEPGHFLEFLESARVGTCTHYATTSALLLRTQGVSTRVVFGFLGGDLEPGTETVNLRIAMAHLWCEVYFPGTGWLPLDPTRWIQRALDDPTALASARRGDAGPDGRGGPTTPGEADSPTAGPRPEPFPESEIPLAPDGMDPDRATVAGEIARARAELDEPGEAGSDREFDSSAWFRFGSRIESQRREEAAATGSAVSGDLAAGPSGSAPRTYRERVQSQIGQSDPRRPIHRRLLRVLMLATGLLLVLIILLLRRAARRRRERLELEESPGDGEDEDEPEIESENPDPDFIDDGSPRGRVIAGYHRLQRSLSRTRLERDRAQTPLEHAEELSGKVEEVRTPLLRLARRFSGTLYHHREPTEEEAREHETDCTTVRRQTR